MNLRSYFILICLVGGCCLSVRAQSLDVRITASYTTKSLRTVITDLEQRYALRFTYSADFLPMDYKLTAHLRNEPLLGALAILFSDTPIRYAIIGGQIALKADPKAKEQLSQLDTRPPKVRQTSPIYPEKTTQPKQQPKPTPRPQIATPPPLDTKKTQELPGGNRILEQDLQLTPLVREMAATQTEPPAVEDDRRLAQISLLPFLGTNMLDGPRTVNNVSVNVLWGANGGVEGLEVGGLVNTVRHQVNGVQVAGAANIVGGDLKGTQAAGLFNVLQGTGFGLQTAGVFSHSKGDFTGVQASGLFNTAGGRVDGLQVASLFNSSRGSVRTQVSGLFNTAGDVSWGQISPLLNVGKRVNGFQIGLINVSDTITGAPIGLLNIVKHGYNRFEIAGSEALYANMALKLGAYRFYNIFHFGARWDAVEKQSPTEGTISGTFMSWALGYGIGTAPALGRRTRLNIEALALHVNELESWTEKLNLLTQLRLTLEVRAGRRIGFFAGPSMNVMFSNLQDDVTGLAGSRLAPYAWREFQQGPTNIKAWLGFYAGFRL